MRVDPPRLDPDRDLPVDPPWGIRGTLFGLAAAFSLLMTVAMLLAAVQQLLNLDAEHPPLAMRYGQILIFQLVLIAIPVAFLWFTEVPARALGFRPLSRIAAIESIAVGLLLCGVTYGYSWGMEHFAPDSFARLLVEQQEQMSFIQGPWILLLPLTLITAPLAEELFFRGFLFGGLRRGAGFALASGLSAGLFALVHMMKWSMPPLFLVGLAAAIVFERHRTLWAAIVMHVAFNGGELLFDALFGGS